MQRIYLDNAATTAIRPEVVDEMANVMKNVFGNPSSTHVFGREAKALIEMSRKNIAQRLNVSPAEIYFTSCGTESNNTIIRSCVNDLDVMRIITTDMEHKCVQESVKTEEYKGNVEVIRLNILKDGNIDTVIGLPANLFFSTGIPVCILVLKKCKKFELNFS